MIINSNGYGDRTIYTYADYTRRSTASQDPQGNLFEGLALHTTRFPVIIADPPWLYDFSVSDSRRIENHYPGLSVEQIAGIPVRQHATENAVLFLWSPSPKLPEALHVLDAWGYQYVTQAVWDKQRMGPGFYFRQQHEILLTGKRGNLSAPHAGTRVPSVIKAPRGRHSEKPEVVMEIIERMYPHLPKLELFARRKRTGWAAWGNEVVSDIELAVPAVPGNGQLSVL